MKKKKANKLVKYYKEVLVPNMTDAWKRETKALQERIKDIKVTVVPTDEIQELKDKLEEEKEVGIRARRIYKALQSSADVEVSLEQKAKALYIILGRMNSKEKSNEELWLEFEKLPEDQKEKVMETFILVSSGKVKC